MGDYCGLVAMVLLVIAFFGSFWFFSDMHKEYEVYWQGEIAARAAKVAKAALGLGGEADLPAGGGSMVDPPQGFGTDGEL